MAQKSLLVFSLLLIPLIIPHGIHAQEVSKKLYLPIGNNITLQVQNNTHNLLVKDYLDSSRIEVTQEEKSVSENHYLSFGNVIDLTRVLRDDERGSDRLYTGHRRLENISLYSAGARIYSPTFGTFIQPDMKEGPNRYAYVKNNPIEFNDPDGNSAISVVLKRIVKRWSSSKGSPPIGATTGHENLDVSRITGITDEALANRRAILRGELSGSIHLDAVARSQEVGLRRIEEHHRLRALYGLPPREMRFDNPREYIRWIEEQAKVNGWRVADTWEIQRFYDEHSYAGGVAISQLRIISAKDMSDPIVAASTLEHELTHLIQHERMPGMGVRRQEHHAYTVQLKPITGAEAPNVTAYQWGVSVRHGLREKKMWHEE